MTKSNIFSAVGNIPSRSHVSGVRSETEDLREQMAEATPCLFRYALSRVRDEEWAKDLVQDTFVKALKATGVPTEGGNVLCAWLCRILRNEHIDQVRRNRVTYVEPGALETLAGDDGWSEERQVTTMTVRAAFSQLSLEHREIITLIDVVRLKYEEAATVLEVPRGTVMSRLARARAAMQTRLKEDGAGPDEGRIGQTEVK